MKRPVILEGGTARNFNAKRLYVRPASGETLIPFVPEDEVALTTKSITENGVYQAKKEGAYGWSSVTVNVPENTSVTGKGQDGKDHTITKDPITGELVDEIAPEYIVVTMPPTTVQYQHGDTIDFSGIVVHAYDSDGGDLGEVPFGELVFPVTVADYDSAEVGFIVATGVNAAKIDFSIPLTVDNSDGLEAAIGSIGTWNGQAAYLWCVGTTQVKPVMMTQYNGHLYVYTDGDKFSDSFSIIGSGAEGYTAYASIGLSTGAWLKVDDSRLQLNGTIPTSDVDPTGTAVTVVMCQDVPVQWPRTGDGAVLEASFVIYVSPVTGGGGQAGGGAGRT